MGQEKPGFGLVLHTGSAVLPGSFQWLDEIASVGLLTLELSILAAEGIAPIGHSHGLKVKSISENDYNNMM